jgi:hypothetical protein
MSRGPVESQGMYYGIWPRPSGGEHFTATLALPDDPIGPTAKVAKPVAIRGVKTQWIQ